MVYIFFFCSSFFLKPTKMWEPTKTRLILYLVITSTKTSARCLQFSKHLLQTWRINKGFSVLWSEGLNKVMSKLEVSQFSSSHEILALWSVSLGGSICSDHDDNIPEVTVWIILRLRLDEQLNLILRVWWFRKRNNRHSKQDSKVQY